MQSPTEIFCEYYSSVRAPVSQMLIASSLCSSLQHLGVMWQHTWRQRYDCNLNLGIDLSASYLIISFHVSSLYAVSHLTLTFFILMETLKAKNHCKGRKCKVWSLSATYYKIKLLSILCVIWGLIYWFRVASSYQKIL